MHSSSNRRVPGIVRVTPIGALVIAPTPPNDVTSSNFSHRLLSMSEGASTTTPAATPGTITDPFAAPIVQFAEFYEIVPPGAANAARACHPAERPA
jgi:hypothetical protein